MPAAPEKRSKFFVYTVESPSALDLYHRRYESDLLMQAVRLDGINCVARIAVSLEAFEAALRFGLPEAMTGLSGLAPVLHISAHGNQHGIGLTSGHVITWEALKELLIPVNRALSGWLLVCMSCCEGYAGTRMAMSSEDSELPFFAIVGNSCSPTWGDTAVAFASFYHLLAKGAHVSDAVQAMTTASGTAGFFAEYSENIRKNYRDFLATVDLAEVLRLLQEDQQRLPDPQVQKFAETLGPEEP